MSWINNAVVKTREQKETEETEIQVEFQRKEGIETARQNAGLKKVTIEQAERFIDNQLDNATTAAEKVEAIRTILKKMVPYILD